MRSLERQLVNRMRSGTSFSALYGSEEPALSLHLYALLSAPTQDEGKTVITTTVQQRARDGDSGAERVVKHQKVSLPVGLNVTRRNRARTASSSRAISPSTIVAFRAGRRFAGLVVAPSSSQKNQRTSVVHMFLPFGGNPRDAGRSGPPRNWIKGPPAPSQKGAAHDGLTDLNIAPQLGRSRTLRLQ